MFRKTHNDGVFDVYTDEMRVARSVGLMTGIPDGRNAGEAFAPGANQCMEEIQMECLHH